MNFLRYIFFLFVPGRIRIHIRDPSKQNLRAHFYVRKINLQVRTLKPQLMIYNLTKLSEVRENKLVVKDTQAVESISDKLLRFMDSKIFHSS